MAAVRFDNLKLTSRQESAGVPTQQAANMAEAVAEPLRELATKADLEMLRWDITKRLGGIIVIAVKLLLVAMR